MGLLHLAPSLRSSGEDMFAPDLCIALILYTFTKVHCVRPGAGCRQCSEHSKHGQAPWGHEERESGIRLLNEMEEQTVVVGTREEACGTGFLIQT